MFKKKFPRKKKHCPSVKESRAVFVEVCPIEELIPVQCVMPEPGIDDFPSETQNWDVNDSDRKSTDGIYKRVNIGWETSIILYFKLFNVNNQQMSYLLDILRGEGLHVANSLYFLKKADATNKVLKSVFSCRQFAYLSIVDNIRHCVDKCLISVTDSHLTLDIVINIDGLPAFKSSPLTIWPILFYIKGSFERPHPHRCMFMLDFIDFISKLCDELKLLKNFVHISRGLHLKLKCFVFVWCTCTSFFTGMQDSFCWEQCLHSFCRIQGEMLTAELFFLTVPMMRDPTFLTWIFLRVIKILDLLLLVWYHWKMTSLPSTCIPCASELFEDWSNHISPVMDYCL